MDETTIENTIDIASAVKDTINTLFGSLFDSIRSTIFPLLDDIVFIHNDITEGSYFEKIFGTDLSSRSFNLSQFSPNRLCLILWMPSTLRLYRRQRN